MSGIRRREFFRCSAARRRRGRSRRGRSRREATDHRVPGRSTPSAASPWVAAFVQRLRELGWIEGRTVAIEYRWAEGRTERFAEIAAEFVRLKVDVIVTRGASGVRSETGDLGPSRSSSRWRRTPLARPCRQSGAAGRQRHRPDRSVPELAGKRLELLREVVPGLRRLAIMANADYPSACGRSSEVEATARTLGLEISHGNPAARRISHLPSRHSRISAEALYSRWRSAHHCQPNSDQ